MLICGICGEPIPRRPLVLIRVIRGQKNVARCGPRLLSGRVTRSCGYGFRVSHSVGHSRMPKAADECIRANPKPVAREFFICVIRLIRGQKGFIRANHIPVARV